RRPSACPADKAESAPSIRLTRPSFLHTTRCPSFCASKPHEHLYLPQFGSTKHINLHPGQSTKAMRNPPCLPSSPHNAQERSDSKPQRETRKTKSEQLQRHVHKRQPIPLHAS